jgi:SPW repeat
MRWAGWTSVIAGLWAIVAPFATGYYGVNGVATTEALVAGLLIAGFGLSLAVADTAPEYVEYLLGLLGIWSAAAPFVLAYRNLTTAFYSDVIVGVAVFLTAIVSIYYRSHSGTRTLHPKTA